MQAGDGAHAIPSPSRALKLAGRQKFLAAQATLLAPQLRLQNISHLHATWANHIADLAHLAAQKTERSWSFAAHARDLWVEGGDLKGKLQNAKFGAVCTRAGEEELRKHGENVIYAPHGLPLDKFPFQPWQKARKLRVVGVGRLVEKKGWMDLVAAVGIAQRYGTAVSAQIIGEGPLRGLLERQIAGQGLSDSIQLRGALPEDEVIAAMQGANCFVLPSRRASDGDRDGLPNVLLEAAALGLPLVTSDSEGARDFVDEDTAWLFPSSDAMALATALGNVVSRPEKTLELCHAARERVENEFDVNRNVEILVRAFTGGRREERSGEE